MQSNPKPTGKSAPNSSKSPAVSEAERKLYLDSVVATFKDWFLKGHGKLAPGNSISPTDPPSTIN